jgi:hypothetical protein
MDTKHPPSKSGQAMVEFCIGLVAMLTVIAGIFQLGRMGIARTDARVEATGSASALSMTSSSSSFRLIRNYIQQNNEGVDTRSYSVDDVQVQGNAGEVYDQLLMPNQPNRLRGYAPTNTLANIQNAVDLMGETGLVRSTASESNIPIMPIIRRLFFDQNTVDIDVTVWSVRTGDLY